MRKEIGLTDTEKATLGSIEVMRVRALGTFSFQQQVQGGWAEMGQKTPDRDREGMSGSLEGDLSSGPSNVPLCHSWTRTWRGPWFRHEGPVTVFAAFEAGPRGLGGSVEPCGAVANRRYLT